MVKVISLTYIFQILYVLCFTRPRYQVSVYRTIGPLVIIIYIIFKEGYTFSFKSVYHVALFNNINNIDSNIYNIIQIKAMVIFRMH